MAKTVRRLSSSFSNIFPKTGKRLIGMKDDGFSRDLPGLKMLIKIDAFQMVDK
jgi:hypothetical protein